MELIDKDAVLAIIEKFMYGANIEADIASTGECFDEKIADAKYQLCKCIKGKINTLEVKEVEEKFECPNIKIKDTIEVSSRMKYVDEDLKPIADFIIDYASWNLHKDEWNQPVLEVPLFRVLDALVQRGKPYCEI